MISECEEKYENQEEYKDEILIIGIKVLFNFIKLIY